MSCPHTSEPQAPEVPEVPALKEGSTEEDDEGDKEGRHIATLHFEVAALSFCNPSDVKTMYLV